MSEFAQQVVPLVDLLYQHEQISEELDRILGGIMTSSDFILGKQVRLFEDEFASFSNARHCVGLGSGTDAVEVALRACDIGSGDEVILPTNTFIATAAAVVRAGATPVFVDCDPEYHLIDVDQVDGSITGRTRAVIGVHLFGQLAETETLADIARERELHFIEDAAQAHGASRNGGCIGGFGSAAAVSFYPGKNLGAYGDAGALLTNSQHIDRSARLLRNFGEASKHEHVTFGINSRLDTVQAAVLLCKLHHLEKWNDLRAAAASRYDELLKDSDLVTTPRVKPGNHHVWHLYVVRVRDRDQVLNRLRSNGVQAAVHYPHRLHTLGPFRELRGHRTFPVSERLAAEMISLPIYPGITAEQQEHVVATLLGSRESP